MPVPARGLLVLCLAAVLVTAALAIGGGGSPGQSPRATSGTDGAAPTAPASILPASPPPPGASPSALSVPTVPAPSRRFGTVAHLMWGDTDTALRDLDAMRAAGLGVVRFDVSWRNMEPEPGRHVGLEALDRVLRGIEERAMRPVITVIETPGWANGDAGPWTPPDDPNAYSRFAAMLAARYATEIDIAWEIWNEPNEPRFWQPQPDAGEYAALLVAASAAIREADPGAIVLGGSILYGDTAFLQAMYDAGAQGTFDGLAVHPYAQTRRPTDTGDRYHSFAGTLDDLREVMVDNGDAGISMWVTEAGWSLADGLSEGQRAEYLEEAVEFLSERRDVELFAVYVWDAAQDARYGLARDGVGGEAFRAYADAVAADEARELD